jgi:hypothetical protein
VSGGKFIASERGAFLKLCEFVPSSPVKRDPVRPPIAPKVVRPEVQRLTDLLSGLRIVVVGAPTSGRTRPIAAD